MARRRMFDLDVVSSNKFIMLHRSAQCLYYTLGMNTDDEGFVANPLLLIRGYGFEQSDLKALIESGFVIPFESGVLVITHFYQNNTLRKDRIKKTQFIEERSQLFLDDNNCYITNDLYDTKLIENK